MSSSDDSSEMSSDNGSHRENEDEQVEAAEEITGAGGADGFADAMSRILSSNIPKAHANPVLAKRKTTLMKQIEGDREDQQRVKKLRAKRLVERDRHMTVPTVLSQDFERQLKKVATKGVIALFNAINKAKRQADGVDDEEPENPGTSSSSAKASRPDVQKMTQANFLEMLAGDSKTEGSAHNSRSISSHGASMAQGAPVQGSGWNALRDDYLTGTGKKLKDWDKALSSSDEDASASEDEDDANPFEDEHAGKGKKKASASDSGKIKKTGSGGGGGAQMKVKTKAKTHKASKAQKGTGKSRGKR
jgi:hypothetical protein